MPLKKLFSRPSLLCFAAPTALSFWAILLMLCAGSAGQAKPLPIRYSQFTPWIGKKFVLLPDYGSQQGSLEYEFTVVRANGKSVRQFSDDDGLYYSKFAQRTITCIAIRPKQLVFHVPDYNIDIAYSLVSYTDDTPDYVMDPYGVITVERLAPLDEIESVRQAYLGKTVWVNNSGRGADRNLPRHYDAVRKRVNDLDVDLPRGTQLFVTDVRWGDELLRPVRLIARDSAGHYFCYEVAADRTNKGLPAGTPLDSADRLLSKTKPTN